LAEFDLLDLGVREDADDGAEFLDAIKLFLLVLVSIRGDASCITVEGFLLAAVPVLVESTFHGFVQEFGPHGRQRAETTGSLDVTNNTNNVHGRALKDGDRLDGFAFVELGSRLVDLAENVRHTSLVAHEGGKMGFLALVIAGERANATTVVASTLARSESKRTVTGSLVLSV
jgi:hypothetical protein